MTLTQRKQLIAVGVKAFRMRLGISQPRLAEYAQLPKATVWKIENGKANPTVETLDKLAAALDIPTYFLFLLGCREKRPPWKRNTIRF